MSSRISEETRARVRTAAKDCCGYCRSQQKYVLGMLEIDHIIPTAIAITFLVMNLKSLLKWLVFSVFLWFCFARRSLFFLLGNHSLTLILFLGNFLVDSQSIILFLFAHYFSLSLFFSKP